MANTDFAFGLAPWGKVLRTTMYCIPTAPAMAIYHQAMVEHTGTAIAAKYGNMVAVLPEETGAAQSILGSILAIFDENMDPVKYIAASSAGDGTVAGYVLVADDPQQLYVAQEDSTGGSIALASAGLCVDMAGTAGSTSTGLSTAELDSSTAAGTATLALKLIAPHPDDTAASANCRWIVSVNSGFYNLATAGI